MRYTSYNKPQARIENWTKLSMESFLILRGKTLQWVVVKDNRNTAFQIFKRVYSASRSLQWFSNAQFPGTFTELRGLAKILTGNKCFYKSDNNAKRTIPQIFTLYSVSITVSDDIHYVLPQGIDNCVVQFVWREIRNANLMFILSL